MSIQCDCGSMAVLVNGSEIYPHRPDLYKLNFYKCNCGSYVGCHRGTTKPLGNPANSETRAARSVAHKAFDPLWRDFGFERKDLYSSLASYMGLDKSECHIGMFDIEQCNAVVEFSNTVKIN